MNFRLQGKHQTQSKEKDKRKVEGKHTVSISRSNGKYLDGIPISVNFATPSAFINLERPKAE